MKVLHVIPNFSVVGGAEMMLSRLIISRPDCQHYVVALINEVDDTFASAVAQSVGVTALHWNGLNTLSVLLKLRRIIRQFAPEVIQSWMYHANILTSLSCLALANKPRLVWGIHHSLAAPKEESWPTKVSLGLGRLMIKHCDAVVYCAHSSRQQHQAYGYQHPQQVVIANGIQLAQFVPTTQIHQPLVVGFAGRYHSAKGINYLFETIQLLQNYPIRFRLAGQGLSLQNPQIRAYCQDLALDLERIEFLEQVDDMPAFYQSIDLLLLTSITEGLPTVLIEAMASAIPCVTTDVGDAGFIVQHCGYVVAPRQALLCRNAIVTYLNLPELEKKQLKSMARQRVEQSFALTQVSQAYLAIWQGKP